MPQNLEPASSKHILIGEDDIDDQEFLKEIFASIDNTFSVVFASNGSGILHYLEEREEKQLPCLLILDYNMPELNGVQVLKELKNNPRYHSIPKIIWSTSRSAAYRDTCLKLGAQDYLVKPSNVNDLVQICRYMLSTCI